MLTVPGQGNVVKLREDGPTVPIPPEPFLLMAAATMHEMGRLVEPAPKDANATDK